MAEYQDGTDITLIAEWDLRTMQYCPVFLGSADLKVKVASQTLQGPHLGILQNKPQSGHAARVRVAGSTKMYAGDTVTRGYFVMANSNNGVINGNSGYTVGIALESATSGTIFQGLILPGAQATA